MEELSQQNTTPPLTTEPPEQKANSTRSNTIMLEVLKALKDLEETKTPRKRRKENNDNEVVMIMVIVEERKGRKQRRNIVITQANITGYAVRGIMTAKIAPTKSWVTKMRPLSRILWVVTLPFVKCVPEGVGVEMIIAIN